MFFRTQFRGEAQMLSVQALVARSRGFAARIAVGASCRWRCRLAALAAALACAVVPSSLVAQELPQDQASGCPTTEGAVAGSGTLVVHAQIRGIGGTARAPGLAGEEGAGDLEPSPAEGATVVVLSPEDPPTVVAEQLVDANGQVVFVLPAGQYTVRLTRNGLGALVLGFLPDGRPVLAKQEVALDAEATQDITLTASVQLP